MTRVEAAALMRRAIALLDSLEILAGMDGSSDVATELDAAALDLESSEVADRQAREAELPDEVNRFVDDVFTRLDGRLFDAGFTDWIGSAPNAPMLRRMLRQSIVEALDGREDLLP